MQDDDHVIAAPPGKPAIAEEVELRKSRRRESLPVSRLSEAELGAIAAAEVPGECAHLDAELDG